MALSFPYAVGSFADVIRMASIRVTLVASQQISGAGGGKIFVADLGPKYWEFEVSIINMENADARRVQALIEALDESINDFYLYDPRGEYPIADPDGSILGAASVTISALDANNKELTLAGLPTGYVLSPGDYLAFDYGTPTKRALHRIVAGATATSGSATVEVRPHIEPGAATSAPVTLVKAAARVKMIPGSYDPGTVRQVMTSGMSFKCRQVI